MREIFKRGLIITMVFLLCVVQSQYEVGAVSELTITSSDNIALGKNVTYSDVEGGKVNGNWKYPQFVGEKVVDGVITKDSRWSAGKTDTQWIQVDLAQEYDLGNITLSFHAEAPVYEVFTSLDGENYTSIQKIEDGSQGGTNKKTIDALGKRARYVKYEQQKMWQHATNGQFYGSSIMEIEVSKFEKTEIKDDTLRIGTFNLAATKAPNVEAQRLLSEQYNLEIIGLQEVDMFTDRNNYDMLDKFAEGKNKNKFFSKAIDALNGEYGIGTISYFPLSETSTTFVDTTGGKEARVYQRSVIEKEGKKIAFYNTHLSFESVEIRSKQLKELHDALENDPIKYKVLVGDFNTDQYQSEFNLMLETLDMANGYQGKWFDTFNGVDATMKVNTIDNIFVSRNLKINDVQVIKTSLSDHNLLTAEVSFLEEDAVSKEWLRANLIEAKAIDTKLYTKSSAQALLIAISEAELTMTGNVTQAVVNAVVNKLSDCILNLEEINLARAKSVTFSGVEGGKVNGNWKYPQFVGDKVVDGIISQDSRWSADKVDLQWVTIDLGEVKTISEVLIYFHAQVPDYEVLLSEDGINFISVFHETKGEDNATITKQVSFPKQEAQYVKFQQNKQFTHSNGKKYGTSIQEIAVYEGFEIEAFTINNPTEAISVGSEYQIETVITPTLASNNKLSYVSSDLSVASVDSNGLIKGLAAGVVTITIADPNNTALTRSMTLSVVEGDIKVSKFIFDEPEMNLTLRDKLYLEYNSYPSNAVNTDIEVKWESSNPAIVNINEDGLIESKTLGSATITVTSKEDNSVKGEVLINVGQPSYAVDYDVMKDRWLRRVVGDENIDLNDSDIKAYIDNIDNEGKELWASLDKTANRTYLWNKIASDTTAADYTTQFTKIKKLALAFGVKGTSLYQNKELLDDIIDAIEFMNVNKKYNGTYSTGNWWDWQIGCTHPLVDTLMIVSDYVAYEKIEKAVVAIEGYAKSPAVQWPSYTATGANRTDIGLAVLGSAIIAKNDERMGLVLTTVPDVMKLVTSGDGLYADGSLIQHSKHAYTGSYGNELLKGVGKIQSIMSDTQWEIKDSRINNVYNTVSKGYIPLMHKGQMMSMVNGRSISRAPGTNPFTTEFEAGSETISNVMLITSFAPEPYKSEFNTAIKSWLNDSEGNFDFYGHARDFEALLNAKEIVNSTSVSQQRYTGMNVYGSMDRVVQANDTYSAGLSMYSSRTYNYEYGNTENKKGWHTADGALYIYNSDLKQYGEGYWPTVDSYRLAGTTVDTRALADGVGSDKLSPQSWVGGTSDGTNGVAGMFLNKSKDGISMDLKAQKSYFFLNGKIVALGSGINGTTPASIETIIENRMVTSELNTVNIDGKEWDKESEDIGLKKGETVHLSGTGKGNDIGYYFFNDQEVEFTKETRTGKYSDINSYFVNDKTYKNDFFKMGINHGSQVKDASYEYMLLPGYTKEELKTYSNNNTITIVQNDTEIQAVKDLENGILAMNVWAIDGGSLEDISVDKSASIYAVSQNDTRTISISNPKQNNEGIKLNVGEYKNIVSMSDKVTQNKDGTFTIDTNKAAGATHTIVVKLNVDKKGLTDAVEKAKLIDGERYTEVTWNAFSVALENAKAILTDENALTKEVENAIVTLNEAISKLVRKTITLFDNTGVISITGQLDNSLSVVSKELQVSDIMALIKDKTLLKDKKIEKVYDLKLIENTTVYQNNNESLTISIKLDNEALTKNLSIISINEDGTLIILNSKIENGAIIFDTQNLLYFGILSDIITEEKPSAPLQPNLSIPARLKPETILAGIIPEKTFVEEIMQSSMDNKVMDIKNKDEKKVKINSDKAPLSKSTNNSISLVGVAGVILFGVLCCLAILMLRRKKVK